MLREPEWQTLADIQSLIYKRVADSLNAALSAVALSDIPDAGGQPPAYWRDRATTKVASVLNLFTAWEYLLRYKMGETVPERAIRPFQVNTLLAWLGVQLQLSTTPRVESNPLLHANQETLQEALLLLYSAAFTQGANVRLELETQDRGMWFRVKFSRSRPLPITLDELLTGFGEHWRARDTIFELSMARDFVRLNGSELLLRSSTGQGEFTFFIWRSGIKRGPLPLLSTNQTISTAQTINAAQASPETQVMAETDLPEGVKKPITGPFANPIVAETPVDNTPVLQRLAYRIPSGAEGSEPTTPRLADVRPPHFPLPATVFGPDTRPALYERESIAPPTHAEASTPLPAPDEPEQATESPAEPDQPPPGDPHLAGIVAAPTPHAPELPKPTTVREHSPVVTITEPVMIGPQPAPTPRLEEILADKSAPAEATDPAQATPPAPAEAANPTAPAAQDTPASQSAPADTAG